MDNTREVRLSSGLHATYALLTEAPPGVTWVPTDLTRGNRIQVFYAHAVGDKPFSTAGEGARFRKVVIAGRPLETTYWERQ